MLPLSISERGAPGDKQGTEACDCYCCDHDRSHNEGAGAARVKVLVASVMQPKAVYG